jgi:glycosyltransferase involved in cell wall biosynthesis
LKKVKVCHFSSVHSIHDTRVFHRECVSLGNKFDVTLIGIGNFSGIKNGIKIIGISPSKNRLFRIFSSGIKAYSEAVKIDASIYHIHDAEMIPFGILLSISGKHVIYDIHENTAGDILNRIWIPLVTRKIFKYLYQLLLKSANNYLFIIPVIAENKFKEKLFLKEGNYCVIQNYADVIQLLPFRISNRFNLPKNEIIYAGMIQDHYYDINPLLGAIEILSNKGIEVKLHVAGFLGWGKFQDILDRHPNLDRNLIQYHGKISQEELFSITKVCKIGICLKNQNNDLVFSHERKLFEYIGLGLPSIFCNREIYTNFNELHKIGIACNIQSQNEIAQKIGDLISDENNYHLLEENCLKIANKNINWESEFFKLEKCYTDLIPAN